MPRKVILLPLWVVLSLAPASCGDRSPATAPSSVIGPATFVDAMVELRSASSLHSSGYLPEGEPERILLEQGLNAEDLRVFVEVNGRNAVLMADLWEQIEQRVDEARALTER